MNLYLLQCGFYRHEEGMKGLEFHTFILTVATTPQEAVKNAREHPLFNNKEMHAHIDALQVVEAVDGCKIVPLEDEQLKSQSIIKIIDSPWKIEKELKNSTV
jgi:hypothetical protein